MARSAVLAGRTLADLVRNVLVVIIITGVGYAVGFRVEAVVGFLAGVALLLLFAYCLSWGFAVIGLSAPNSETAQVMAFPDPVPADVRRRDVRACVDDAGLAAGFCEVPAGRRGLRPPAPSWWAEGLLPAT